MSTAQLIIAAISVIIPVIGGGAFLRARSQNQLDRSTARGREADAEQTSVETAREVVTLVRQEMATLRKETDAQVDELRREVSYLRGALHAVQKERDELRRSEEAFRKENGELRRRIGALEGRITALTDELARAATASVEVHVPPADARAGGRRASDPPEGT